MTELTTKAENYAAEKTNEMMTKAIAQAYADGYRDGYKDREEEIPVDLCDNKTEYVDLGLPSGTLWSNDYEKDCDDFLYLPYGEACGYGLPNLEQMKESLNTCRWKSKRNAAKNIEKLQCIGPNGNVISFSRTGYIKVDNNETSLVGAFWIKEEIEEYEKYIGYFSGNKELHISTEYSGYKLPIRLVRTK